VHSDLAVSSIYYIQYTLLLRGYNLKHARTYSRQARIYYVICMYVYSMVCLCANYCLIQNDIIERSLRGGAHGCRVGDRSAARGCVTGVLRVDAYMRL